MNHFGEFGSRDFLGAIHPRLDVDELYERVDQRNWRKRFLASVESSGKSVSHCESVAVINRKEVPAFFGLPGEDVLFLRSVFQTRASKA
jgi:hypothetical protein